VRSSEERGILPRAEHSKFCQILSIPLAAAAANFPRKYHVSYTSASGRTASAAWLSWPVAAMPPDLEWFSG
jgi:hypothetical protein